MATLTAAASSCDRRTSARQFEKITGSSQGKIDGWLKGAEDIPTWVPPFLALLSLPGGMQMAEWAAGQYLNKEETNG